MNLNEAAENAHKSAIERERNGGPKIRDILKHCAGEVIEAAEARVRSGYEVQSDEYGEELADVIICILIAAYEDGVDIENAVNEKMRINAQRAAMRGDKL
jgi:NTP pyrophosphatase (non-canonical NTP hydrolase)